MSSLTILVVGATGQQGSSLLLQLSYYILTAKPEVEKVKVLALTRSAASPKAQALPTKYGVLDLTVVEGDTRNPAPIFAAHPDINAVFSYTLPPDEEPQATALVDAAASHTQPVHFVFSSVDRGGEPKSWDTPTDIEHFAQKHNVEVHLRAAAEKSNGKLVYTILRPTAFMDNLNPGGAFGVVFAGMWGTMPSSRKLQLVSVRDIGMFAAKALLYPSKYQNRAMGLAGDDLTLEEARAIYRRVAGQELPQAWSIVGWAVRWLLARHVGTMFRWFESDGYGVDIPALKREEERLQDFEGWLKESSKFECGKGQK